MCILWNGGAKGNECLARVLLIVCSFRINNFAAARIAALTPSPVQVVCVRVGFDVYMGVQEVLLSLHL